jgi:BlaI family transcriptional regulator, penicillinase repressor
VAELELPITDAEWRLLEALWTLERATARAVAEELHDSKRWAYSTVKTMLDRMVTKGLVDARQVGNVWEFSPALKPDDARRSAWKRFVGSAFGGATAPALAFIASEARLTRKQRETLLGMLEERGDKS